MSTVSEVTKVTVSKKDLCEALSKVKHTVSGSEMIQILKCFSFKEGRVASSNGSAGTVTACDVGGAEFCVLADKFRAIAESMHAEIELEFFEGYLHIKSGKGTFKVGTFPTRGFPDMIPNDTERFCEATNFVEAIKRVEFTIGDNAIKQQLMGVGVCGNYVYSGDGKRISRMRLNSPATGQLTIPKQSVNHILSLGQPDYVFRTRSLVGGLFSAKDTIYAANCVAEDFPFVHVDQVLANLSSGTWVEFPEDLPEAVHRVKLMAASEETQIIVTNKGMGLLEFEAKSEVGSAIDAVSWNCQDKFRFAVRPDWLVKAFEQSRRVDISDVIEGGRKHILRFASDDGFEHILALMILRDE